LNAGGESDAEVTSNVIRKLSAVLEEIGPEAAVFLGDTNTVMGCVAAAQLNIPVVHIEGCMRSYDWRMPEEKYRTVTDHLSDVIYAYLPRYKQQGVAEGLNPANIVVTGNPIVDILNRYYFSRKSFYDGLARESFFASRGMRKQGYYLMTCHRRENVHTRPALENILQLAGGAGVPVYFPASYRTQRTLREWGLAVAGNVIVVDPVGYDEFLTLMVHSLGVFTDSGTVVEEACVLGIPSVQMRKSTERPEVYEVGSSVKFDPTEPAKYPALDVIRKAKNLRGKQWEQPFGDGQASARIATDLLTRIRDGGFRRHEPANYHIPIDRAYRGDGLNRH
jgi:UDP-N-acetylglucosamine 2-epimerase (non-hydrolysing)